MLNQSPVPSPAADPLRVNDVEPSNGGILVSVSYTGADNHHDRATVIKVGRGVPWLNRGDEVMIRRDAGTTFRVASATTSLPLEGISVLSSDGGGSQYEVFITLVEQRDVLAVIGRRGPSEAAV
jgi:hypothetical protein